MSREHRHCAGDIQTGNTPVLSYHNSFVYLRESRFFYWKKYLCV